MMAGDVAHLSEWRSNISDNDIQDTKYVYKLNNQRINDENHDQFYSRYCRNFPSTCFLLKCVSEEYAIAYCEYQGQGNCKIFCANYMHHLRIFSCSFPNGILRLYV